MLSFFFFFSRCDNTVNVIKAHPHSIEIEELTISVLNTLDKTERDGRRLLQGKSDREGDGIWKREREGNGVGKEVTESEIVLERQEDKKKRSLKTADEIFSNEIESLNKVIKSSNVNLL